MFQQILTTLVSLYRRFFRRRQVVAGPGPQMFVPEEFPARYSNKRSTRPYRRERRGTSKYRRWRKTRMQMQRESRRRNRAER